MKRWLLLGLVLLMLGLAIGCGQPADVSRFTEEEISALVWAYLPDDLGQYKKADFNPDTRETTYLGNNKWLFVVEGMVEERGTYGLELSAHYYEKTGVIEVVDIKKWRKAG